MPFLLIPLQKLDGTFLIVDEDTVASYKITYTPQQESYLVQAGHAHHMEETDFASSPYFSRGVFLQKPLWSGWSQPTRRDDTTNDAFYLFREDGGMIYLTAEGQEVHLAVGEMRHLPIIPNGAVASIRTDRSGPDVFLIGGECYDGGVYNVSRVWLYNWTYVD